MVWVKGREMVMEQFREHGWYRALGSHGLLRRDEGGLMVSQERGMKKIRG